MDERPIAPRSIEPFAEVIGRERVDRFAEALAAARELLGEATVWHVNSTATGGGVAEILQNMLSYPAGAGIDIPWLVIDGGDAFFEVTKRVHHLLHGSPGDGGPLADEQRRLYEETLLREARAVTRLVRSGDIVILHDPQVLGLAPSLAGLGARVIWSCHVGADRPNDETRRAWGFLAPYLTATAAQTFSRVQYRWENLAPATVAVIPPCIDAYATKNRALDDAHVTAILDATGIVPADGGTRFPPSLRQGRTGGRVAQRTRMIEDEPLTPDTPIACQVSRWDPLKDHRGLMRAFTSHVPPGSRRPPGAGRPVAGLRRRRPRGPRDLGRAGKELGGAGSRATQARAHLLRADGRRRRERRHRERPPAPIGRHRSEEPRRGLRPDGGGGDVEGAADGREPRRRHPGPDRGRRVRTARRAR